MPERTDAKEEILQRIDILDLISEHVNLKKAGRSYKGLCPFHPEKTPSFQVDKEKQLFYCFGCHTGGDAFTFLMKIEGLTFPEAMETLARRCGLTLTKGTNSQGGEYATERKQILEINQAAKTFFQQRLWAGGAGLYYLRKRGLGDDFIKRFELGFAVDSWDALMAELRRSFPVHLLLKAGLICSRQSGSGYYDRFRNRVIFPIHDIYGDVCGFGGRLIEAAPDSPKYLNSPETPAYTKGQILYGLYYAKNAICQKKAVIICEGYLDLLTLFQAGFTNAVATLGTALTVNHVRILKRYADNIILVFDSDMAGQKAAERGIELFLDQGITAKVATLPPGRDPDSMVREEGKERFALAIEESKPFIDFLLNYYELRKGEVIIQKRAEKADHIIHFLARIGNPLEQDGYIHYIAQKVGISEDALRERLRQLQKPFKRSHVRPFSRPEDLVSPNNSDSAEKLLIKLALQVRTPSQAFLQNIDLSDFKNPELREIADMIVSHWRQGISIESRTLLMEMYSERHKELISQITIGMEDFENPEQAVQDCLKRLRQERINEQLKEIKGRLNSSTLTKEEEDLLLDEYQRLKRNACSCPL